MMKMKKVWRSHSVSILAVLLLLIVAYNTFTVTGMSKALGQKIDDALESSRPSKVQLVSLVDKDCSSCFDIQTTITSLKNANIEIESEQSLEYSSTEGQALVREYSVTKIPALVVTGEIDRDAGFESEMDRRDDALVFEAPSPPYTDSATGQQKGLVSTILIENRDCVKCFSFRTYVSQLGQSGVTIADQQVLNYREEAAQELIERYKIEKLPSLILSVDIAEYTEIAGQLSQSFIVQEDDNYVSRTVSPPYFSLKSQSVAGLVTLTFLTDSSCESCYDVNVHKSILSRMGVVVGEEKVIDASSDEGQVLISRYGITKVPTIILSSDAQEYGALINIWPQVGITADDGTLIFTKVESMGTYRDLSTGDTITQ